MNYMGFTAAGLTLLPCLPLRFTPTLGTTTFDFASLPRVAEREGEAGADGGFFGGVSEAAVFAIGAAGGLEDLGGGARHSSPCRSWR